MNGVGLWSQPAAPARMEVVGKDRADFGVGAVIGQKHVAFLIEDCLRDAGVMSSRESLPSPSMPQRYVSDEAIAAVKADFGVKGDYAVLIPVCAANRPMKRWPQDRFVEMA